MLSQTVDPFARISGYYETLVRQHGYSSRACDYGRPESQRVKFRVLSEVTSLNNVSVLDVGCGFADFARYLHERFSGVRYSGIDLCPSMIHEAQRQNPNVAVRVGNILDDSFSTAFDVVIANGIFYLLGDQAWPIMQAMIRRMFGLATSAVAFNSLSAWAEHKESGEFYADPVQVANFCRRLTPRVVLRHDYHPRDFTIYLYKTVYI